MKIDRSGACTLVTQEPLDVIKIRARFQKMGREAVSQGVNGCLLPYARFLNRGLEDPLDTGDAHGCRGRLPRKQPLRRPVLLIVQTQYLKVPFPQQGIAILKAFTLLDPDHHPVADMSDQQLKL